MTKRYDGATGEEAGDQGTEAAEIEIILVEGQARMQTLFDAIFAA